LPGLIECFFFYVPRLNKNHFSLGTNGSGPRASNAASSWSTGGWGGSTWLLLRNLTPQIDGSTLKTLCLQHGPLQNFHLYLSHGLAMAKYQSREEAAKVIKSKYCNCFYNKTKLENISKYI